MPPPLVDIVAVLVDVTAVIVIGYIAVVVPASTVTLAGTWAATASLLVNVTTAPPAGAAALSVTVPVEGFPPSTDAGSKPTALNVAAGATLGKNTTSTQ